MRNYEYPLIFSVATGSCYRNEIILVIYLVLNDCIVNISMEIEFKGNIEQFNQNLSPFPILFPPYNLPISNLSKVSGLIWNSRIIAARVFNEKFGNYTLFLLWNKVALVKRLQWGAG